MPLGRIGNFLNGELYGNITAVSGAVIFLRSGDLMPYHLVLAYEALALGPVLALMLYFWMPLKFGSLVLGYLFGYSVLRFLCEIVRKPDIQWGYIGGHFTMG